MGFMGFETPEENYAKAKARYYAKHGRPKHPKPIRRYGDGWYDPNIKYSVLQTRQAANSSCLMMTGLMAIGPAALVALAVRAVRR